MTIKLLAPIGASVLFVSTATAQQQPPATAVQAVPATAIAVQRPTEVVSGSALPSNSDVWVSMDQEVNSKRLKMNAQFPVTVSRDVMLGNYVVIPRGTPGHGRVSYRTGKGAFGKSAKMEFDLTDISLNGRQVPIAGHYRIEGGGNTGATVATAVAVGVFSAFVTGRSAIAAQGSKWKAATKEPLMIQIADAPRPAMSVPAGAPASAQPAVVTATPPAVAPAK